jgi:CDP-diacylglycerol--serine O-phosphatidyltransferase
MVGSGPTGWFTGLPSPAAGGTIALYYPFSQTDLYQRTLAYLDLQDRAPAVLLIVLAVLMVSSVKYPKSPKISVRTLRGIAGLLIYLALAAAVIIAPASALFPIALGYVLLGILRFFVLSLLDRPDLQALQAAGGSREAGSREEPVP